VIIQSLTADTTTPAAGQTVHLNAVLYNQGTGPATGYRLVWKPSDGAPSLLIANSVALAVGGSASFDFDYTWTEAGSFGTQAVVTPGSYARSLTIVVSSPFTPTPTTTPPTPTSTPTAGPPPTGNPNLVVTSLSADPGPYVAGTAINFTAIIQNIGDGPANGFRALWRDSSSSPFQQQADGQSLDPGGILTIGFSFTYSAAGTYDTQEVVEFSAVHPLGMSKAAALSNAATLTIVVNPAKASLTTPTVTVTVPVTPTTKSAPVATATPTREKVVPTATEVAVNTATPAPTSTPTTEEISPTATEPPVATATPPPTATPELGITPPPPAPPTAVPSTPKPDVAPPPAPPTAGSSEEAGGATVAPPTAAVTLAPTDTPAPPAPPTPARLIVTLPAPTVASTPPPPPPTKVPPTPHMMVTAIHTAQPTAGQRLSVTGVRKPPAGTTVQPTVTPVRASQSKPKLPAARPNPPTPVHLVVTMPPPPPPPPPAPAAAPLPTPTWVPTPAAGEQLGGG
jgi:hypothetical protein